MAAAGAGRSVYGDRESCSICLEPFRGRDPKTLPCFHTFCLACLAKMAEKARIEMVERQKVFVSTNDPDTKAGTEDIFINCPSCRKAVQVPAKGVQKFQGEEGHVQPLLCDQSQMASHGCTKCQTKLCFHCHHVYDLCPQPASLATAPAVSRSVSGGEVTSLLTTGRGQMEVLSKVLSCTAEEEKELHKQRKTMEDNLQDLYSIGLARLVDARDDILRKIRSHTETSEKKLKSELADLQGKYDALARFTSQSKTGAVTVADLRTALMSEPELSKLQTRAEQKPVEFFRLDAGDRSAVFLVNSLRELVFGTLQLSPASCDEIMLPADSGDFDPHLLFSAGTIPSSPHTPVQHPQQGYADIAALSSQVDDLARKLEITVKKVTESESKEKRLQVEMRSVMDELRGVRDKNSFLIQDLATMQGENVKLRKDMAQLQRNQQSRSQDSADRQQTGASNIGACPQKASGPETSLQILQLQQDILSLQCSKSADKSITQKLQHDVQALQNSLFDVRSVQASVQRLQSMIEKTAAPIYFIAELDHKVTTNSQHPLIFKCVLTNVGGGYDNQSGMFYAPVSGTYIFLVSVAPHIENKAAALEVICGNDNVVGAVCSDKRRIPSSAQCILDIEQGQMIWLRTLDNASSFDMGILTTFSGMLLKPKLNP